MSSSVSLSILNLTLFRLLTFLNPPKLSQKSLRSQRKFEIYMGLVLMLTRKSLSSYRRILSHIDCSFRPIDSQNYLVLIFIFQIKEAQRYQPTAQSQREEMYLDKPRFGSFSFSSNLACRTSQSSSSEMTVFNLRVWLQLSFLYLRNNLRRIDLSPSQQAQSHQMTCFWVISVEKKTYSFFRMSEAIFLDQRRSGLIVLMDWLVLLRSVLVNCPAKLELRLFTVLMLEGMRFFLDLMCLQVLFPPKSFIELLCSTPTI